MGHPSHEPAPATHEEMRDARVPISFRDSCAHLLIPLNQCRQATMYSPLKCTDLRHEYEKCQYIECVRETSCRRPTCSFSPCGGVLRRVRMLRMEAAARAARDATHAPRLAAAVLLTLHLQLTRHHRPLLPSAQAPQGRFAQDAGAAELGLWRLQWQR